MQARVTLGDHSIQARVTLGDDNMVKQSELG